MAAATACASVQTNRCAYASARHTDGFVLCENGRLLPVNAGLYSARLSVPWRWDQEFESAFLQQRVSCELDSPGFGAICKVCRCKNARCSPDAIAQRRVALPQGECPSGASGATTSSLSPTSGLKCGEDIPLELRMFKRLKAQEGMRQALTLR
jgi:hypothetical protein